MLKHCMECGGQMRKTQVEGKDRSKCVACGWVYWEDPKVVVAVIVSDNGRVLLGKRGSGLKQGLWSFPAGFVDRGERIEDAGQREVREETGLEVRLGPLLILRSAHDDPVILAVYPADIVGGSAAAGEELTELRWFLRDDLPELAFRHDSEVLDAWWAAQDGQR